MPICAALRTRGISYANRDIVGLAEAAQAAGKDILNLNIGDPNIFDFATPPHICEAVIRAIRDNKNGYSHSSGLPEAREAIRATAESRSFLNIREIIVTQGGSEAIDIALSALVNSGDNVIIPAPGYPLYAALLSRLEAQVRRYQLSEADNWQPDLASIESQIDSRSRAIVLINPNNPTGAVYGRETILAILDICRRHELVLISDEIYDRILFNGNRHFPSASLASDVCIVTINGLSKNFIAPGFRCGWNITSGPENICHEYVDAMLKLSRIRLSANHPVQYGIKPALEGGLAHLEEMRQVLSKRATLCAEHLNAIEGITCVEPQGAFYAFPRVDLPGDEGLFVKSLIRETGVIVVHGSGFGLSGDPAYFRVVTLPDDRILERAFNRIDRFLQIWRRNPEPVRQQQAPVAG